MLKLFFNYSNCRTYFLQNTKCSKVLCYVQIYLFWMSILLHWETKCHLPTRIKEYLQTDAKSHILQHLNKNPNGKGLCDDSCFIIIHHASSSLRLKLKEALDTTCLPPVLDKQKNHVLQFPHHVRYFDS